MKTPVFISTPNIPTRTKRMIHRDWEERRRLRHGGDTLVIDENKIMVNGVPLRNVVGFATDREISYDLMNRSYSSPYTEVTIKLMVKNTEIIRGDFEY